MSPSERERDAFVVYLNNGQLPLEAADLILRIGGVLIIEVIVKIFLHYVKVVIINPIRYIFLNIKGHFLFGQVHSGSLL